MLKREITYTDFNDQPVTEVFYFNISKSDLIELEVEQKEGFGAWIQGIIKAEDHKTLVAQFKRLVLLAYGEKSEDGKRFVKTDENREAFSHTAAYETLFFELATNTDAATNFILGVMPRDMIGDVQKAVAEAEPVSPTPAA